MSSSTPETETEPGPSIEPIAIIGLACRLPGGADTPAKLWDIVHSSRQCWEEVPGDRYTWRSFHHPDPDARGTHNARGGFFLSTDLAAFDAPFFSIPAAEAAAIDPQQRLLLEVTYEALENAGLPLADLRGSSTGVYVALVSRDYDRNVYKDPAQIPKHHLTGCGDATACGRISYVFDLRGPCMSLDTGCSGSMVGLHLACQALRLGETDQAIVGGTNLLLGPDMTVAMSGLHMINENGRCYPFDSRGAGYGRAEGVAAIVLKRLKDAIRDGDPVRAVIRNTGLNQDGKTNGILLPSSEAQQALTSSLYVQAGLDPRDVSYVEAHGTGTQAGDAAEVSSIKQVFADKPGRERPLFLGSIKANLGHSESTSGLAGVIKTVLALEKSIIPPLAGLETVKPELELMLESGEIILPQMPQPWPHDGPRLASVNSFGFGGTNAHVILESAPSHSHSQREVDGSSDAGSILTPSNDSEEDPFEIEENPQLFVISAKSKASLETAIQNMKNWVSSHGTTYTKRQELAKTLSTRRSLLTWRTSIVASSYEGTLSALENPSLTKSSANTRLVFLFTGQGAQYHGMGKGLLLLHSSFSRSLHRSQDILAELGASWKLVEEILREESSSRINSSELSQPATTAIQIALVDMLAEANVHPTAVLGHSSGEVAAAYAAGILGHREALTIAYHKGFVAGWCKDVVTSKGAMLAVGLGEAAAMEYVHRGRSGRCVVACVNSPSSVTVSGDEEAVTEMQKLLNRDSVFNRRLKVDIAYHSHHMQAVAGKFRQSLQDITAKNPEASVRFFSSVTGLEKTSPLSADYWVDNLVSQVRFAPALEELTQTLSASSSDSLALMEIGPHAALQGPIRQIMNSTTTQATKWSYTPSLLRTKDAYEAALEMIGGLFEHGIPVNLTNDLSSPHQDLLPAVTDLPPYPWDHNNQYWHESRLSKEYRFREHAPHDLLGLRLTGTSTIEPIFRHILSVDDLPWLQEHIIDGFALYPGSAFLCMAIEALKQVSSDRGEKRQIQKYVFHEVSFSKALVVPDSPGSIEVLVSLRPSKVSSDRMEMAWEEFRVTSVAADGTWNEHCRGSIRAEFRGPGGKSPPTSTSIANDRLDEMKQNCQERMAPQNIYAQMRRNGVDYGPSFTIIQDLQIGDHQAIGKLHVPDIKPLMPGQHLQPHVIHPTVFDAFMHIVLPLYHRHCSQGPVMLTSVGEVSISADILNNPGDELLVACRLTSGGRRHGSVEVSIFQHDDRGGLIEVGSLSREDFRAIGEGGDSEEVSPCYSLEWTRPPAFPEGLNNDAAFSLNINISCLPQTPETLSLADNLFSGLSVNWNGKCSVVQLSMENMDRNALNIIFVDEFSTPATVRESITGLVDSTAGLWVTVSKAQGLATLTSSALLRLGEGCDAVTLHYHDDPHANNHMLTRVVMEILFRSFSPANVNGKPIDREYVYRDGSLRVPKLELNTPANEWLAASSPNGNNIEHTAPFHADHTLQLHFKTPGLLDSAVYIPVENRSSALEPDEVTVRIYAHAVNKVDVAIALDRAEPTESMLGEFAGVIVDVGSHCADLYKPGDRVCGWGSMPYTNTARVNSHNVHPIDQSISFIEGASIPVAFQTAAHALMNIAGLEKAQRILIHGAAGAVGQAGIAIARYLGAEIYATVGSSEKEELLISRKGIPGDRIFTNRSLSFRDEILKLTAGTGVDVVLNCSSGELLDESIPCIADFGFLVDVTKSKRPLSNLGRNISFASIDMQLLSTKRPRLLQKVFREVMALYHAGRLAPITPLVSTLSIADISSAFRLVQSQRYSGKIVLSAEDTIPVKQTVPKPEPPRLSADASYAVVGNASLNRALCAYLESRGAKNVLFCPAETVTELDGIDLKGILYVNWTPKTDSSDKASFDQTQRIRTSVMSVAKAKFVDFCITLASIEGLSDSDLVDPCPHSMTLRLASIESVKMTDLHNVLDYCISSVAHDSCKELFTGLDKATCPRENPIFSAIFNIDEAGTTLDQSSPKKIDQQIASAGSIAEVHTIVMQAAIAQLSSFLAIDPDDIQEGSAVADLGLDSLLAIEFKNWVVRTTQAPMQTSEVLDASSLTQLVELIVRRSKLVKGISQGPSPASTPSTALETVKSPSKPNGVAAGTPMNPTLPPLPIPELKTLIDRHLSYLRAFATDNEFKRTLQLADSFQAPGGTGTRLYDRLQAIKAASPDTWYHDLYLQNQYLVRNGPLAPFMNFFFTHPLVSTAHSQAERAALVAATVIEYKYRLDDGLIQPRLVNEQPLCMDLYKYLFSTTREPTVGVDSMRRYPGNNYFVVLRRGHVYRVEYSRLEDCAQTEILEDIFEMVLKDDVDEVDWLGILTADDRISWAKNRQSFMDLSPENTAYIQTIEQSAFVVCLDDASPETAEERGRHFHFSDGSNRWHDKPIEFIITANGASGILGDHTGLDAGTVHELNTEIADRIRHHTPSSTKSARTTPLQHTPQVKAVKYSLPPSDPLTSTINSRIEQVRRNYTTATASREHRYPPPLPYGSALMKRHKIPANSAFQLIAQLAGRYYFNHTSPCWETVLQSNFRTGRVEINQVVSTQVAAFIDAAATTTSPATCKQLLINAARTHSSSVLACTRAGGSDRFLSMLREIVEEGEDEPGLYHDPVYKRARPRKFISNCFPTGMAENGCCLRDDEGIWLHFEVEEFGVRFSILGPTGQTQRFCDCLVKAAERVWEILES